MDPSLRDPWCRELVVSYLKAKRRVLLAGFENELCWQETVLTSEIDEPRFLEEAAWVVLSSGMRESVVRRRFDEISSAFGNWKSAKWIVNNQRRCEAKALAIFRHTEKIQAIIRIAEVIDTEGVHCILQNLERSGPTSLQRFPYIGPVTSFHLAKNLGIHVAKPDRHLQRVADRVGAKSVNEMCRILSSLLDEPIPIVDIVIWRYATLNPGYLSQF